MDVSVIIEQLSDSTDIPESIIVSTFRNVSIGESFLLANNFSKIKKDLALPSNMTATELSEIIINSI
jgi:hypothetical protein